MARIEGGGELLQRALLAGTVGPFKQDDGASAICNLGQLQLPELLAQGAEHVSGARSRKARCPFDHRT
jgi:hypothetical protein